MKQRRIVTVLAIIAVTGAVSVPNSRAMVWRLGVSDRHVADRGGLEWNQLIHTVADTDGLPAHDPEYQTLGHPEHGPIPIPNIGMGDSHDQGRYTGEHDSGSLSNEGRYGLNPSEKESSGFPTAPYGGVPTTPSADSMMEDLSRAPR